MTILNIIAGTILIIIIISTIRLFISQNEEMSVSHIVFCSIYFGMIIPMIYLWTTPQAIDVYRCKTTLEITYKDSIPIDSVVVWKEDER